MCITARAPGPAPANLLTGQGWGEGEGGLLKPGNCLFKVGPLLLTALGTRWPQEGLVHRSPRTARCGHPAHPAQGQGPAAVEATDKPGAHHGTDGGESPDGHQHFHLPQPALQPAAAPVAAAAMLGPD